MKQRDNREFAECVKGELLAQGKQEKCLHAPTCSKNCAKSTSLFEVKFAAHGPIASNWASNSFARRCLSVFAFERLLLTVSWPSMSILLNSKCFALIFRAFLHDCIFTAWCRPFTRRVTPRNAAGTSRHGKRGISISFSCHLWRVGNRTDVRARESLPTSPAHGWLLPSCVPKFHPLRAETNQHNQSFHT